MVDVDLYVWVCTSNCGHIPGVKRVKLPCVPRCGDMVAIDEHEEGTKVYRVILLDGQPIPIVIIRDIADDDDAKEALEFWSSMGFEFDRFADKYLKKGETNES